MTTSNLSGGSPFKHHVFKVSVLAFFASAGFFAVLVVLAASHWAATGRVLGLSELIYAGLYGFFGLYVAYRTIAVILKYVVIQPSEVARLARARYHAVRGPLALTSALGMGFLFLALTGLDTPLDSFLSVTKIPYPSALLSLLFLPVMAGQSFIYPLAIHLQYRLAIPWAASILWQLPAFFQLAVIYFLARIALNVKRRRVRRSGAIR